MIVGPSYIRPNQSYLYSMERREKRMQREHKNIMDALTPYLIRVHHVPATSPVIQQFAQQLETCLYQKYMSPISYLSVYRLRKEMKLVKSIRYRLKKPEVNFFLASA